MFDSVEVAVQIHRDAYVAHHRARDELDTVAMLAAGDRISDVIAYLRAQHRTELIHPLTMEWATESRDPDAHEHYRSRVDELLAERVHPGPPAGHMLVALALLQPDGLERLWPPSDRVTSREAQHHCQVRFDGKRRHPDRALKIVPTRRSRKTPWTLPRLISDPSLVASMHFVIAPRPAIPAAPTAGRRAHRTGRAWSSGLHSCTTESPGDGKSAAVSREQFRRWAAAIPDGQPWTAVRRRLAAAVEET